MGGAIAARESEHSMDALAAVREAVDQLPAGTLGPLLDLLADDVQFEVAGGGELPGSFLDSGRQAAADYFAALGGLMGFWRMEYSMTGDRVIAWVRERFTLEGCGLEGEAELALVLELGDGRVDRLLVIEDLAFIPGWETADEPVAGGRPAATRAPGVARGPLVSCRGVGVMGKLLRRPPERVAAGAPA